MSFQGVRRTFLAGTVETGLEVVEAMGGVAEKENLPLSLTYTATNEPRDQYKAFVW